MDAHQQQQQQTHSYEAAPSSSSRPTLGFPLGTALLLVVIFCLSGMLSCCYHWDKLQSLRRRVQRRRRGEPHDEESAGNGDGAVTDMPSPPSKAAPTNQKEKKERTESLPVIMPGDRIPKFIAWPRPSNYSCGHDPLPGPQPAAAAAPRPSSVPLQEDQMDKTVEITSVREEEEGMPRRPYSPAATPPLPSAAAAPVSCATTAQTPPHPLPPMGPVL